MGDTEGKKDTDIEAVIDELQDAAAEICAGKVWYKSRVVWTAILLAAAWAISMLEGYVKNELYLSILSFGSIVVFVALRFVTKQPVTVRDLSKVAAAGAKVKDVYKGAHYVKPSDGIRSYPEPAEPADYITTPIPPPAVDGTPVEEKKTRPPGYGG